MVQSLPYDEIKVDEHKKLKYFMYTEDGSDLCYILEVD